MFTTFDRLFVELILSFQDRDNSQNLFKYMSSENAFKVFEIELGFIFYVLDTKGTITFPRVGTYLRFINVRSTVVVLVFCSFAHEKNHSKKIDWAITFLLLAVAIFLELYAIVLLVSSDWTDLYLTKHPKTRKAIAPFQRRKHLRWSNSLAQHSLLSFCLKSMSNGAVSDIPWSCKGQARRAIETLVLPSPRGILVYYLNKLMVDFSLVISFPFLV